MTDFTTDFTQFVEGEGGLDDPSDPTATGGIDPTPTATAEPNLIDTDIQSLIDLIRGQGGVQERFMSAADRLNAIATGRGDRALRFEEARELGGVQEQFRRRGLGFSAAAVNAAGRTRQGFAGRRLARRDAAQEAELEALSAGVETAAIPTEFRIAQLVAERAGETGGGGLTVICTVLHEKGDLPSDIYSADQLYGATQIPPAMLKWYQTGWGARVASKMRSNRAAYVLLRPFAKAWAYHMAFLLRRYHKGSRLGAIMLRIGLVAWSIESWRRRHMIIPFSEV